MSYNKTMVCICLIAATFSGVVGMLASWESRERENNLFAEKCNARGGEAIFQVNVRQCILPATKEKN